MGIWACFLRLITKNRKEFIFSGSLGIFVDSFGMCLPGFFVSSQSPGVKGEALITKIPPTNLTEFSERLRQLWVGCRIEGFLQSPYDFMAKDLDACWDALQKGNPNNKKEVDECIYLLTRAYGPDLRTFLFPDGCFIFRRKEFVYQREKFDGFGFSVAGRIVNLRR